MKRLIYVLNAYSDGEASHFFAVFALLEAMAERGCAIKLVLEKARGRPQIRHPAIELVVLWCSWPGGRHLELFARSLFWMCGGYRTAFVRIAAPAAIALAVAARLSGARVFLWQSGTTHAYDADRPPSLRKLVWYLRSWWPNRVARKLVHCVATGPEAMIDYYASVVGVRKEKIRLLYNDADLTRFAPDARDRERREDFLASHRLDADTTILLLVHRLSPVRRTTDFIAPLLDALCATGESRRCLLLVAGGGSELHAAREIAAATPMAPRCVFLGDVPSREVAAYYRIADVFLNPSANEGFPRVVIEAMAAGLPIVATDAGGTRDLLGAAQQRFVCDRARPAEFARSVVGLLADPEAWRVLKEENRARARRYSTPAVADMYVRTLFA